MMRSYRLLSCLDIKNGNLAKSVRFVDTKEIGDPVAAAKKYCAEGIDELALYDINASHEGRGIMLEVVRKAAEVTTVPFSVGGGIASVNDAVSISEAGAQKINVNSAAVKRPALVSEIADKFGRERTVLAMDVLRVEKSPEIPSGFEIIINGGREHTGLDALAWAAEGERLGAGEIVLNSIDADGTKSGFDNELTRTVAQAVSVPVVASGGGGTPEHVYDAFESGQADAVLVSSMLHYGDYTIGEIKKYLSERGLPVK